MTIAEMSEERLREIIRDEIQAERLAAEDHDHPELAHDHYGLAPLAHDHNTTHEHYGEYAEFHHVHHGRWG
jgi:hypothetical protein